MAGGKGSRINRDKTLLKVGNILLLKKTTALLKEMFAEIIIVSAGDFVRDNFTDYKIPTSMDIPEEIVPIYIEVPQPDGPFGARGVGEHTMIPAAPMIANAVDDALNIRITSMPITAEKVALSLLHKGREKDE